MADLLVETRIVNTRPILDLSGEVDSYNSPKLRDKMISLIDEINPNIIINLSGVDYIDSTGLGTLVAGLKRARDKGGDITIICPHEQIFKVFHITGLVRVFTIYPSEDNVFSS